MLQAAGCGVPKPVKSGEVKCGVSVSCSERPAVDRILSAIFAHFVRLSTALIGLTRIQWTDH